MNDILSERKVSQMLATRIQSCFSLMKVIDEKKILVLFSLPFQLYGKCTRNALITSNADFLNCGMWPNL